MIRFDDEECWKHGGPQMLWSGFFKYWQVDPSSHEFGALDHKPAEQRIKDMETLEKGMVHVIQEIIFHSVHSFHIGVQRILKDADDTQSARRLEQYNARRSRRIKNNPDRPKSLLHRIDGRATSLEAELKGCGRSKAGRPN